MNTTLNETTEYISKAQREVLQGIMENYYNKKKETLFSNHQEYLYELTVGSSEDLINYRGLMIELLSLLATPEILKQMKEDYFKNHVGGMLFHLYRFFESIDGDQGSNFFIDRATLAYKDKISVYHYKQLMENYGNE
jgi:hypothetical protein